MPTANVRKSVIGIINEVEDRLGLNQSATLSSTKFTTTLLNLLNDVIDEISDFGDWPEMWREWKTTAQSSVGQYEVIASAQVKNIYEVVFGDQIAPMEHVSIEDIRRLQRVKGFGTPRHWCIVGVSGVNPLMRVAPVPTTAAIDTQTSAGGVFDVAGYKKPSLITSSDVSAVPAFSSRMLVQGLYAKALLEENGGMPSREYETAYAEYLRMRREAHNRMTADSGADIYFTPIGRRLA